MSSLVEEMEALAAQLKTHKELQALSEEFTSGIEQLKQANEWILSQTDLELESSAVAFNYLMLAGTVSGAWLMAKASLATLTDESNSDFNTTKIVTTHFLFSAYIAAGDQLSTHS